MLDDVERLLGWSRIGPHFSNSLLQVLSCPRFQLCIFRSALSLSLNACFTPPDAPRPHQEAAAARPPPPPHRHVEQRLSPPNLPTLSPFSAPPLCRCRGVAPQRGGADKGETRAATLFPPPSAPSVKQLTRAAADGRARGAGACAALRRGPARAAPRHRGGPPSAPSFQRDM